MMAQYSINSNANSRSVRSPPAHSDTLDNDSDSEHNRDSHDLSLATRGRESLLDNLLLSFDKIGDGFNSSALDHHSNSTSPYLFNPTILDEAEDTTSTYSRKETRRIRTGSAGTGAGAGTGVGSAGGTGYNLQYPQRVRPELDYGYESESGSFGVTYGGGGSITGGGGVRGGEERDSNSRSRGARALDFDPLVYDSAPAPSIRTRNRTPSPPRSPRLARRPSNKSIRSLRNAQEQAAAAAAVAAQHFALPPIPAFATPQTQQQPATNTMATPIKATKQGFFRRVFGGGSSNTTSSSNNSSKTPTSNGSSPAPQPAPPPPPPPPMTPPAREVQMDTAPSNGPHQVITKKSSFFRRRKKSVSDVRDHPMPPPPVPAPIKTSEVTPVDVSFSSPTGTSSSLRNAMKDYLPSPAWNHDTSHIHNHSFDDQDLPEPSSYLANGQNTIRKVTSSDPIGRPGFFDNKLARSDSNDMHYGSSPDSNGGKLYKKDTWGSGRSGTASGEPSPLSSLQLAGADRPSSSPFASIDRTFFHDQDDEEMWPHSTKRSNGTTGKQPVTVTRPGNEPPTRDRRRPSVADSFGEMVVLEPAVLKVGEFERQQVEDEVKKEKKTSLNLDTKNLEKKLPRSGVDQSWFLSTASPAAHTPTVTLQRDGEDSVPLDQDYKESAEEKKGPEAEEDEMESLVDGEFTEKELDIAQKIFDGDEEFIVKEKAAAWLGDPGPDRIAIRKAYFALFDWHGVNILSAMRIFCGRLVFKGEAQQVDRLMDEFARRWCTCNPNNGFKGSDVVHTILYSILLLNTDLHMADIPNSQRMTRGQFLKNTMATIRRVLEESSPDDVQVTNRSATPYQPGDEDEDIPVSAIQSLTFPMPAGHKGPHSKRPSLEFGRDFRGSRMSRIGNLSPRLMPEDHDKEFEMDGGLALVKGGVSGGTRMWETQVEVVLKDFYKSIQAVALPLHGSPETVVQAPQSSLSVWGTGGMLRRSNSTISKAPSELSVAGRERQMSAKPSKDWTTRNRSRQRVYNGSFAGSSRTSLEDRSSVWSPSASSTWSKYSLNKTQTSMSVDSLGTTYTHGDYQQSIGFANALSHAIIREEAASGHSGSENGDQLDALLDGDEELELHGAPWAKEGLLKHKHHLESVDKRAKNRNWTDSFAVIQRGYMRLFQFPSKSTNKASNNGIVGGGNWIDNAEPIGTFLLRQTIASALPPPGYSKTRPHVWALSLPSGAVHFFEVGTADIVKEFVSTANYWSARLSKEPLTGGVSNVEYGWSDALIDSEALTTALSNSNPPSSPPLNPASPPASRASDHHPGGRPSLQMSVRSSFDQSRPRLPGDKATIKDWTPPAQTMVASNLKELDQLKALENYVANVEEDLRRHNELRPLMMAAFRQGSVNQGKAAGNWEKKSSYLLKEIIKFRTYIETLGAARRRREEFAREKAERERAKEARDSQRLELTA